MSGLRSRVTTAYTATAVTTVTTFTYFTRVTTVTTVTIMSVECQIILPPPHCSPQTHFCLMETSHWNIRPWILSYHHAWSIRFANRQNWPWDWGFYDVLNLDVLDRSSTSMYWTSFVVFLTLLHWLHICQEPWDGWWRPWVPGTTLKHIQNSGSLQNSFFIVPACY